MVSRGLLMVVLAVTSGSSVSGCRGSAALPPSATILRGEPLSRSRAPAREPVQQFSPSNRFDHPGTPVLSSNPWKPNVPARDWKYIVIHHTATARGSVESIHRTHRNRRDKHGNRWLGIGYHFVIGNGEGMPDGAIEPTFRWRQQLHGAHAGSGDYNEHGIGIAMVGNFNEAPPSSAQLAAVKRLVGVLKTNYRLNADDVLGHNDIKATACPGKYFPLAEVSRSVFGSSLSHWPGNDFPARRELVGREVRKVAESISRTVQHPGPFDSGTLAGSHEQPTAELVEVAGIQGSQLP